MTADSKNVHVSLNSLLNLAHSISPQAHMQARTHASPHAKHTLWTLAVRPTCQTAVRPGTQGSRGRSRSAPPLPRAGSWFPGQQSRCTQRSPCSAAGPEGDVAAKGEGGGRSVRAVQGNELKSGGGVCTYGQMLPCTSAFKSGLFKCTPPCRPTLPPGCQRPYPAAEPPPPNCSSSSPSYLPPSLTTGLSKAIASPSSVPFLTSGLSKAMPSSRKASARPCVPRPMGLCLMLLFLAVSTG